MTRIRNDVMLVKELNIEIVRSAIRSLGRATKAELAAATGISVVSCTKILNDLCLTGEVIETDQMQMPAGHGRAARIYQYNAGYQLVACVYFATDHGKIMQCSVVADLVGEIVEETVEEIRTVDYGCILQAIGSLRERHEKIRVCAVGLPASVIGGVIKLSSFSGLVGMPLQERLQNDLADMKILVETDTNAIAYGLYRSVCEDRDTTIGLIFSPDGVCAGDNSDHVWRNCIDSTRCDLSLGAGFVAFGRILRGFSGFAGEIWSLPIAPQPQGLPPVNAFVMRDVILSITAVLNPEIIALTGGNVTEALVEEVRRLCSETLSPVDMPTLLYRSDTHMDYVQGLIHIALEQLSCGVEIVKKEI